MDAVVRYRRLLADGGWKATFCLSKIQQDLWYSAELDNMFSRGF